MAKSNTTLATYVFQGRKTKPMLTLMPLCVVNAGLTTLLPFLPAPI